MTTFTQDDNQKAGSSVAHYKKVQTGGKPNVSSLHPPAHNYEPAQLKPNHTGLPNNLKSGIEQLSGYSMDGVKVHYNSNKPAQLNAHAYAQGTNIHLASGQEKHLPHEAWHVVQQKQGRVKPTLQTHGVSINDDKRLEQEADRMGVKALQMKKTPNERISLQSSSSSNNMVQRVTVQSEWLKKESENIETAPSSAGPWTECTDKTNAGYRQTAEESLGSLAGLNALSKYEVIPPAYMKGRGPLARAHLIAAEFGGQLKYAPTKNIRYHPLKLEYGDWQQAENDVGGSTGRGYVTASSAELGTGTPFLMALKIGDIVENEYGFLAGYDVTKKIEPHLEAAAYVPSVATFRYTNIDNPDLNIRESWGNLNSVLSVQPASANQVFGAMHELGIPLPEQVLFDAHSSDIVINTRQKMLELIDGLGLKSKARTNLIKKINNLKTAVGNSDINVSTATEAINKHPHLATKAGNWILGDSFPHWADLV
ncbi:MAG: DUF4157 domain-containing protein [Balneolaceae bacterium]|nr:DUF4157 domain-containing protein [Balneolaceae bacterium]